MWEKVDVYVIHMNIYAHKTLRVAFSHRRKTGDNLLNLLLDHAIRFFKVSF